MAFDGIGRFLTQVALKDVLAGSEVGNLAGKY
jgi:hypothetical protein